MTTEPTSTNDSVPTAPLPPPPALLPGSIKAPLISVSPYGRVVVDRTDLPLPCADEEIQKSYSNAVNWGWLSQHSSTIAVYTQCSPLIQQGPQCGLVALTMASQALRTPIELELVLEKAKSMNITNHGEMFSATDFADLSKEILPGIEVEEKSGWLQQSELIIETLARGKLLLAPYDSHKNHMPTKSKGHRAHWALICGCLIQTDREVTESVGILDRDCESRNLFHLRTDSQRCEQWPQLANKSSQIILLWRQGKSRGLVLSPLQDFMESNEQLFEYPPSDEYVIKSVEEGLKGKIIVLSKP